MVTLNFLSSCLHFSTVDIVSLAYMVPGMEARDSSLLGKPSTHELCLQFLNLFFLSRAHTQHSRLPPRITDRHHDVAINPNPVSRRFHGKFKVHRKDLESKHREVSRNRVSVSSRPAWNISGCHKRYKIREINGNSMQVGRE